MARRLKLMTFNVLGATVRAETEPWEVRGPICVDLINQLQPDVLAIQELEPGNFETLVAGLSGYEYELGPVGAYRQIGYQSKNPHNYNAIYWRPETLEVLDLGGFWLSETPERPSQDWAATLVTGATWARFQVDGAEPFVCVNTHLDIGPEIVRTNSVRVISEQLGTVLNPHESAILCGDVNAAPNTPAYKEFLEQGFVDVYSELRNEESPQNFTIHLFEGDGFSPLKHGFESSRIDQFWVNDDRTGVSPVSYSVVRDSIDGQYPSDHYPVVVEFDID